MNRYREETDELVPIIFNFWKSLAGSNVWVETNILKETRHYISKSRLLSSRLLSLSYVTSLGLDSFRLIFWIWNWVKQFLPLTAKHKLIPHFVHLHLVLSEQYLHRLCLGLLEIQWFKPSVRMLSSGLGTIGLLPPDRETDRSYDGLPLDLWDGAVNAWLTASRNFFPFPNPLGPRIIGF